VSGFTTVANQGGTVKLLNLMKRETRCVPYGLLHNCIRVDPGLGLILAAYLAHYQSNRLQAWSRSVDKAGHT